MGLPTTTRLDLIMYNFPTQAAPHARNDLGTRTNIKLVSRYVVCGPVFTHYRASHCGDGL
jgi:hypothetical protein